MIPINRPVMGEEEAAAAVEVIRSGLLTDKSGAGPKVTEFEKEFARFLAVRNAVAVSTGTAALHAALLAVGVGPGDEVIVPSFTFHATAEAVLLAGAKPVFADIDPETYTLSPESVEEAMGPDVTAVMPVHLYGLPADLDPIVETCKSRGIALIEDAAQAHGAMYRGRSAGTIGQAGCFSFYAGKNLAVGEGGMVTTSDDEVAAKIRAIRSHGEESPYNPVRIGNNYHMGEINAAIGLVQLRKLPGFLERRRANARAISARNEQNSRLVIPKESSWRRHAWNLYTVRIIGATAEARNGAVKLMREDGVGASVYYEKPVHMFSFYSGFRKTDLSETVEASRQVMSLPTHPGMSEADVETVANTLSRRV